MDASDVLPGPPKNAPWNFGYAQQVRSSVLIEVFREQMLFMAGSNYIKLQQASHHAYWWLMMDNSAIT